MKRYFRFLMWAILITASHLAIAENRGINITISSIGGPLDSSAQQAIRRIIGYGVANGVIDDFTVYAPKIGGPIFKEGGMSACAEAGFSSTKNSLNAFIKELRTIKPKAGTVYHVEQVENCAVNNNAVACTMDVQQCPDGSFVGRVAPSCDFAPCPGN